MAAQILYTAWSRLHRQGVVPTPEPPAAALTQFRRGGEDALPGLDREVVVHDVAVSERPPLARLRSAVS
jgi:glucosyl-3-phosphoglycerate synthase